MSFFTIYKVQRKDKCKNSLIGFSKQGRRRDLEQFQLVLDRGQLNLLAFSPVNGELECHTAAKSKCPPVVEIVSLINRASLTFTYFLVFA